MEIIDFFLSHRREQWLAQLRLCDWRAARLLVELLEQDKFHDVLGEGTLYLLGLGTELVSFMTLAERDCIDDAGKSPWIGFVYTVPKHRGKRYAGRLMEAVLKKAKAKGVEEVYICTDHVGLYEKYGFTYVESKLSIYGEMSRVYVRKL